MLWDGPHCKCCCDQVEHPCCHRSRGKVEEAAPEHAGVDLLNHSYQCFSFCLKTYHIERDTYVPSEQVRAYLICRFLDSLSTGIQILRWIKIRGGHDSECKSGHEHGQNQVDWVIDIAYSTPRNELLADSDRVAGRSPLLLTCMPPALSGQKSFKINKPRRPTRPPLKIRKTQIPINPVGNTQIAVSGPGRKYRNACHMLIYLGQAPGIGARGQSRRGPGAWARGVGQGHELASGVSTQGRGGLAPGGNRGPAIAAL